MMMTWRRIWILAAIFVVASATIIGVSCGPRPVQVGSKAFTENAILGDALRLLAEHHGYTAEHRTRESGSGILFQALQVGEIDIYPEYTGTLARELLAGKNAETNAEIRAELATRGVAMTDPLGFNNTYALAMRQDEAQRLGIHKISDLAAHPDLTMGFSNEFVTREDGWLALAKAYALPHRDIRGMKHEIAYEALKAGKVQVMDVYSTDATIRKHTLRVLADDRDFFPRYDAVILYRAELGTTAPAFVAAVNALAGKISEAEMIAINALVELENGEEIDAAKHLLDQQFGISSGFEAETVFDRLARTTREHTFLVGISMLVAIVCAIPLGIVAAKAHPIVGGGILGVAGVLQTVPSLALLALFVPFMGIGPQPAIVALFLYSLLPIVRNTFTGLRDIDPALRESALALGLPAWARLWKIELPLSARAILAGIKTSAVINVGVATLGTLIGAGGYGDPIMTGLRRNDPEIILQGLIPAAVMALLLQGFFDVLERLTVSPGLRLKTH